VHVEARKLESVVFRGNGSLSRLKCRARIEAENFLDQYAQSRLA
jgi:hypothetical protein